MGHLLKTLFRNDDFMDKLVNAYIMSTMEEFDLNCAGARVLLNAMPGLESAAVFQDMVSRQKQYCKIPTSLQRKINGLFVLKVRALTLCTISREYGGMV